MSHGNRRRFRLIGLTGAAGAGKDTVAKALGEIGFKQYALASPIKRALNAVYGWTMEQWDDRAWKEAVIPELGFSPRRAAQVFGTEFGRALHENVWVDLAAAELKFYDNALEVSAQFQRENPEAEVLEPYVGMVISDVRFENEARWVRKNGGEIWHIVRPGTAPVAAHSSEAGITREQFDIEIFNAGSINGVRMAAKMIVEDV